MVHSELYADEVRRANAPFADSPRQNDAEDPRSTQAVSPGSRATGKSNIRIRGHRRKGGSPAFRIGPSLIIPSAGGRKAQDSGWPFMQNKMPTTKVAEAGFDPRFRADIAGRFG
jgi:hypothetical protein